MITIDDSIREQVNSLLIDIYGEIRIDTGELVQFRIMDGISDVTTFVENMNGELYERLKEKIKTHLINLAKDDGAQL
jgi:hypothetical protein